MRRFFILNSFVAAAVAAINGPFMNINFPDPCTFQSGSTTYAFATNSGGANIPVATSPDGGASWSLASEDALPNIGGWASTGNTWAPDVITRSDGTFVLYYAAESISEGTHCIGAATSTNPTGPYAPTANAIACATAGGGAIDPAGFQDTDGTYWVVYKVDGNNLGGGGSCGNGDGSHSTPLMLQQMESDAITPTGSAIQILDRSAADGPLIEAPDLVLVDGVYFLFFSSNCYNTDLYDISYATASSVTGPYTKATGPFKVTGDNGLTAPGGFSSLPGGGLAVFHATTTADPLTRMMYTANVAWSGTTASA
ncbi:glycoside hydrolase family 43 protein [Athelia psychrophila]|uniref:Glycoside hydrolase family 43 protein n=1 Tax=Athelia psychrophila TaxID=1759441 RepID=A0A166AAY6_9AGAM|nr:glycoside hydrolase family 43 protein [Fibularhizoctonia sp. CBS 109695]